MCALIRFFIVFTSLLFIGCASEPERPLAPVRAAPASSPLINYALSLQGTPYHYGKDNPDEGFDCSGFVKHVYQHEGIAIPRTVQGMVEKLTPVPKNKLHSGDLVFFNINGDTISHVGIYLNNAKFIHAPSQRTGKVLISNLNSDYWRNRFCEVRRP
jgi:cell wall-associated NlpC family hydrolase